MGFDSAPGKLETELILRSAALRDPVLDALGVPVLRCGALLRPRDADDRAAVAALAANAVRNGVEARLRGDGALEVPGEAVTDPVAYTLALAAAAGRHGAELRTGFRVAAIARTRTAASRSSPTTASGRLPRGRELRRPPRRRGGAARRRRVVRDLPAQGRVPRVRARGAARAHPAPGPDRADEGRARLPDARRQGGRRARPRSIRRTSATGRFAPRHATRSSRRRWRCGRRSSAPSRWASTRACVPRAAA